jgi:hypothetical protein
MARIPSVRYLFLEDQLFKLCRRPQDIQRLGARAKVEVYLWSPEVGNKKAGMFRSFHHKTTDYQLVKLAPLNRLFYNRRQRPGSELLVNFGIFEV